MPMRIRHSVWTRSRPPGGVWSPRPDPIPPPENPCSTAAGCGGARDRRRSRGVRDRLLAAVARVFPAARPSRDSRREGRRRARPRRRAMPFIRTSRLRCARFRPAAWPHPGEKRAHQEHPIPHSTFPSGPDPVVQTAGPTPGGSGRRHLVSGSRQRLLRSRRDDDRQRGPARRQRRRRPEPLRADRQHRLRRSSTRPARSLYGPVPTNTLWSGFGGGCQTNNDGDATVVYDRARRPLGHQPVLGLARRRTCSASPSRTTATRPARTTATRSSTARLPRLPEARRLAGRVLRDVQPFNADGSCFPGPEVCAYDRAKMLAGQAATQQCFTARRRRTAACCPSDLDGATPPPAGSPNYLLGLRHEQRSQLWKFHVDWTTPANSTLHRPDDDPGRRVHAGLRRRRPASRSRARRSSSTRSATG